jgi:Flp pilus assembly protein CpaB
MSTNLMIMIVLIVLITSIAGIVRARMGVRHDRHGNALTGADRSPEAERLREEVKVLKERVAVLERIATDRNHALEHEIERLRDR